MERRHGSTKAGSCEDETPTWTANQQAVEIRRAATLSPRSQRRGAKNK